MPQVRSRVEKKRSAMTTSTHPTLDGEAMSDHTSEANPPRHLTKRVAPTTPDINSDVFQKPQVPIVTAKDYTLYYGKKTGVEKITMDIMSHTVTAIIGPSGCGKSTFLRSINRMNDLIPGVRTEGLLTVDGQDIHDPRINLVQLRRIVGMVFQRPNPFPKSIYDNVAYGPRLKGIRNRAQLDEIVKNSLEAAALWKEVGDSLKKSALSLSGGQQQRLCIARALSVQPDVLLMDEPTSALDPISTSKIEDLVVNLKKDYTIVIVTHNMQQATRISDNTGFFLLGELIEYGDTEQIFSAPRDKRCEDYITGRFG